MAIRRTRSLLFGVASAVLFGLVLLVGFAAQVSAAPKVSTTIVISQVYGGGGNTGATYKNDFIELFNRGTASQSLSGWSVQYASAAGTFSSLNKTDLPAVTLAPGQYFLIQEAAGTGGTTNLPTPDVTGTIAMGATTGKVALVDNTTVLSGSGCPFSASVVDFVGYGASVNCSETSGTITLTNTTAALRLLGGCTDADNNSADFTAGAPTPRNTASPFNVCGGSTNPSGVGAAKPNIVPQGGGTLLTVSVTPGTAPTSTGIVVTCTLTAIGGAASQNFFDDGTNGDVTAGDNVFSYQATVDLATPVGAKNLPCNITDAQARSGTANIALTVTGPALHIHDVQGAAHLSPYSGTVVSLLPAIVTAKRSNGFYIQDPSPDSDDATSEGIFVFTSSAPGVVVSDSVSVGGFVSEFRAGGASGLSNLTITELTGPSIVTNSTGNALPPPIVLHYDPLLCTTANNRCVPTTVIEDDAAGSVETGAVFDPANDGIDFYESLEGMRVEVDDVVATGPTLSFGGATPNHEIQVLADNGLGAGLRTPRGGIIVRASDFNPERVILNDLISAGPILPQVVVNDKFMGSTIGIMDYSFGNFKLQVSALGALAPGGLVSETASIPAVGQMALGNYNVENLSVTGTARINQLASIIVNNLHAPDLMSVQEIQDDSGFLDDGTISPTATINAITSAIMAAGGPLYQYRSIEPVNDQDGGAPGANIRQVFMFRTDRGLAFIDTPCGCNLSTTGVTVTAGPHLSFSPGRIDPTNSAWNSSRKPLAAEFNYNGHHFFAISNHFDSKGGDDPLFGRFQPPNLSSAVQRVQQAQIVHDFVNQILAIDPNADVIVLGDLNDFEFSTPMLTLKGSILYDLSELLLPENERYTYDFDGNSQALDHIMVSQHLSDTAGIQYDIVHVNSEFLDSVRESDHEPEVAFMFSAPTAVVVNHFDAHKTESEAMQTAPWLLASAMLALAVGAFVWLRRRAR